MVISTLIRQSKLYLDKPYVKVAWNPEDKILLTQWIGFAAYEEIKAVGNRIIEAVQFEKAHKILYDTRGLEIIDDRSRAYISGDFTKGLVDSGIKYAATVLPDDLMAQDSVDSIRQSLDVYIKGGNKFFKSINKAMAYLKERE